MLFCVAMSIVLSLGVAEAGVVWSDGFESYAGGSNINGQGGWFAWDNDPAYGGTVTSAYAASGLHSLRLNGNDITFHGFTGYTSGTWTFRAKQYIPSDFGDWSSWAVEDNPGHDYISGLDIDVISGGAYQWDVVNAVSLVYDQWVDIAFVFDLNPGSHQVMAFYNHELIGQRDWWVDGQSQNNIDHIVLYGDGNPDKAIYYDDFALDGEPIPEPAGASLGLIGLALLVMKKRRS